MPEEKPDKQALINCLSVKKLRYSSTILLNTSIELGSQILSQLAAMIHVCIYISLLKSFPLIDQSLLRAS